MAYAGPSVSGYSPSLVDYSPVSAAHSEPYTPSSQHPPQPAPSTFVEPPPAGRGLAAFVPPSANSAPPPAPNSIEQQHVLYYFQSVLPIQYIFAADALTNVLHDVSRVFARAATALPRRADPPVCSASL